MSLFPHIGEAEALALALRRKLPLAVDDLPTIKACKILNHKFTTAIHFHTNYPFTILKYSESYFFKIFKGRIVKERVACRIL